MISTLTILLLAHCLGDFVLQSNAMVRDKRKPLVLLAHGAIHLGLLLALTGQPGALELYGLVAAHLVIDRAKLTLPPRLIWFLTDQLLHGATLLLVASTAPDLWANSLWATAFPAAPLWAFTAAAAIWASLAGGPVVGLIAAPYRRFWLRAQARSGGLPDAGRRIGELERAVAFMLVLTGNAAGVGLLIAAKSVLRFGTARDSRALSEYVLIGTLASIGWALGWAFAAQAALPLVAQAAAP